MSAPVVTMTFSPSAHISTTTATTRPLMIRPRRGATPLFLHRTPIFPPRSSAPIPQHDQSRSSASTSPLCLGQPRGAPSSRPQFAPAGPSPSTPTFIGASAPPTSSGSRSTNDSAMGRPWMASSEAHQLLELCEAIDVDGSSPLAPLLSRPPTVTSIDNWGPASSSDGCHLSRSLPSPSSPSSVSSSPLPSPLPQSLPFPSLACIEKDLPPIPSPTEPATPLEDVADPLPERPSRIPSIRPVSYDAEATIRELEELAASIMLQDPMRDVEQLAASLKVFGIPDIETDLWRNNGMPAATAEESSPITPRPSQFEQKIQACRFDIGPAPRARLAVPQIMVTNPSTESLLEQVGHGARSLKERDQEGGDAEELSWMEDYGAWGTSEKGKWKAFAGEGEEEEAAGHEQSSKAGIFPPARPSLEKAYMYEPVGAPEFLVGSSTSPIARAASGYRSRRPSRRPVPDTGRVHRRSRRPGPLVLANPAQAEWEDLEAQLAASLFLRAPKPRRPQTSPSAPQNRHQITPSAWPPPKKSQSANAPTSRLMDLTTSPSPSATNGHRRPGSTPAMPLTPAPVPPPESPSASRGASGRRAAHPNENKNPQAVSWPSFPFPAGGESGGGGRGGSSSEPSTPRPSPRPRLKSLKSLFKHWSK